MNNLKNAKTMNKIKILLLALVAFFGIEHAGAQAVKVYKKDGTSFIVPYSRLDKIITRTQPLEWVDLGLPSGIKWAAANVGADYPEDCGYYFAWGELSPKDEYRYEDCLTYNKEIDDISGNTVYDAAAVMYDAARMPTRTEINELYRNCEWEWTTVHGVNGTRFTGLNGNSIFLPAAGYRSSSYIAMQNKSCYFWTSTPFEDQLDMAYFCYADFETVCSDWIYRDYGLSIRAVNGDKLIDIQTGDAAEITDTTVCIPVTFTYVPEEGIKGGIEYVTGSEGKEIFAEIKADGVTTIKLDSLRSGTAYIYRAFAEKGGTRFYGEAKEFKTTMSLEKPAGLEWIDLGLPSGIKWASMNIGARTPEQPGGYFAWGELDIKDDYLIDNSILSGIETEGFSGNADYDAATANWGAESRMPTKEEFDELTKYCTKEWITQNGVKCVKLTGPNDNSIILPLAGTSASRYEWEYGYFWTSDPESKSNDADNIFATCALLYEKGTSSIKTQYTITNYRLLGLPVRPVTGVNMQLGDATNIEGKTADIPVTFAHVPAEGVKAGIEYTVGEEVKKAYADVKADGEITIRLDSLTDETTYTYRAFAEWDGGFIYSQSKEFTTLSSLRMPENMEWVDLGLPSGIKWASVNIGAQTPEEYGGYFAWGEISPKDSYDENNYLYANTDDNGRYQYQDLGDISGNGAYDAARANWGGYARMPTFDECDELINFCDYQYTTYNGVKGFQVTGPNGNSIFLPAAGERDGSSLDHEGEIGFFWSSTLLEYAEDSAYGVSFNAYGIYMPMWSLRYYGHPIRPVMGVNMQLGDATNITDISADIPVTFARVPAEGVKAGIEYSVGEEVKKVYADVKTDTTITIKLDGLKDNTTYQYRAFTELDGGFIYSQSKKFTTIPPLKMPENMEWVDLGLPSGIKWAQVNIGAQTPEEHGGYFAWGEILPKDSYDENNYLYANTDDNGRYQYQDLGDISGNGAYDAARANWGGYARMPTNAECQELVVNCIWENTTYNGVKGVRVIGPNRNSIFLPAVGHRDGTSLNYAGDYGFYWSSMPYKNEDAHIISFEANGHGWIGRAFRCFGLPIRPVMGVNIQMGDATKITSSSADIPVTFTHVPAEGVMAGIEYSVGEELKKAYLGVEKDTTITICLDGLTDNMTYQYRAFAELDGGFIYSQSKKFTTKCQWVDLGLPSGVKWARYNVGADSPEQYGDYFAYGENRTKDSYDKYNYAYGYTDENRNYYCLFLGDISGNGDYDAARANWSGYARMPTKAECEELITSCTWENTTYNGVNGKKVTGPNGNSIFIPAAGERNGSSLDAAGECGYYWSSTSNDDLIPTLDDDPYATSLYFSTDNSPCRAGESFRYLGRPVRPVLN